MDKIKTSKIEYQESNQSNVLKDTFYAERANKEGVQQFWSSLTPKMKTQIQNKYHRKDVFKLLSLSIFAVQVVRSKSNYIEGLFFYGLEGELAPEKWGLPIPLHDFDYSGSLFLQVKCLCLRD
jgi:hypothetical protein